MSLLGGLAAVVACSSGDTAHPSAEGTGIVTAAVSAPHARMPKHVYRYTDDAIPSATRATGIALAGATALEPDWDRDRRFPAFRPDVPQLVEKGGPTLRHPRVVSITWDGDPGRDTIEAFGDQLGESSYWRHAVGEYGVGETWSGRQSHIHLPAITASLPFDDLMKTLRTNVANATTSGWPRRTDETIYAFYLPPNLGVTFDGFDVCKSRVGGWHEDVPLDGTPDAGPGPEILYSVIFRCGTHALATDATEIASHEIGESATDPLPNANPALVGYDPDHLAYEVQQGYQDENGDACEFFPSAKEVEPAPFPFEVQRLWSNAGARSGRNPCSPREADPYFNVTTFRSDLEDLTLDLTVTGDKVRTTKGLKVALGASRTFDIGFYSSAPTSGDWTVTAITPDSPGWAHVGYLNDAKGAPISNGKVTVSIDRPTGHDGHRARVTVTPTAAGAIGGEWIVLRSALAGATPAADRPILNDLPLFVGQQ